MAPLVFAELMRWSKAIWVPSGDQLNWPTVNAPLVMDSGTAGAERPHLVYWLSKRLDYQLLMPDLEASGLKLVGGRLLPGPFGPAAFCMYEGASGERFTIYYARTDAPQTALRYRAGERFAAFFWVENGLAYVVSGPGDRERLLKVAQAAYDQIDKGVPAKPTW